MTMRTVEDAADEEGARMAMRASALIMSRDDEWRAAVTQAALEALQEHGKPGTDPLEAVNHMRRRLFGIVP